MPRRTNLRPQHRRSTARDLPVRSGPACSECGSHKNVITYAKATGKGKITLCPRCQSRPDALWREDVQLGGRLA